MKNKKNEQYDKPTVSSEGVLDTPENVFEQLNKYGTYEIQPTADRADFFPAIAQGLPTQPTGRNMKVDKTKSKLHDNAELWSKKKLNKSE